MNTYNYIEERFENDLDISYHSTFFHPVEFCNKCSFVNKNDRAMNTIFISYDRR